MFLRELPLRAVDSAWQLDRGPTWSFAIASTFSSSSIKSQSCNPFRAPRILVGAEHLLSRKFHAM